MEDQTIWIGPRATAFTEVCEACAEEQDYARPWVAVSGVLRPHENDGWAQCPHGHRLRVYRITAGMPAGALR